MRRAQVFEHVHDVDRYANVASGTSNELDLVALASDEQCARREALPCGEYRPTS
jgi:hypothetical protein